jgi:hypothetical protein
MIARLINWYRRNIHRHPAAQDRRARAELARKARIAADERQRAKCLDKFGIRKQVGA